MAYERPRVQGKFRPNRWQAAGQIIRSLNLLPPAGVRANGIACKTAGPGYIQRDPRKSRLRALFERELENVRDSWHKFRPILGPWLYRYWDNAQRFLSCGIMAHGFARFMCSDCGFNLRVPFSCKTRLCPSCTRKRMTLWSEWLSQEVLLELYHRHWVFTIPRELRKHFFEKRWLLNKLSSTAARVLMRQMRVRCPEPRSIPGVIAVIQTSGDAMNFNPHVHMIATTHCMGPSGKLYRVPYIPYIKLSRIWKTAVLRLLVDTRCISRDDSEGIWSRYPNGFNLNGEVKDSISDREVAKRLAEYLIRPAMSESRLINYDKDRHWVVYRARGKKDFKTGKRPRISLQMDAKEFLARLLVQIPPKGQKLVNHYGLYSNKIRGMWKKLGFNLKALSRRLRKSEFKFGWRSQIWKIYEVDPLRCRCGGALILMELVFPPDTVGCGIPP